MNCRRVMRMKHQNPSIRRNGGDDVDSEGDRLEEEPTDFSP